MSKTQLELATQLHDYVYRLTVGATVNYGAFHGFFKPFPELGLQLNQSTAKLVGALHAAANQSMVDELLQEVEGQLMLAMSTTTIAQPDAQKALGLLDLVKGEN